MSCYWRSRSKARVIISVRNVVGGTPILNRGQFSSVRFSRRANINRGNYHRYRPMSFRCEFNRKVLDSGDSSPFLGGGAKNMKVYNGVYGFLFQRNLRNMTREIRKIITTYLLHIKWGQLRWGQMSYKNAPFEAFAGDAAYCVHQ